MKEALITCLMAASLVAGSPRRAYSGASIQPYTQTGWGSWGTIEWCPRGTFAVNFHLKVEATQGGGSDDDDTALNAINLYCSAVPCQGSSGSSKWIHSEQGPWGSWRTIQQCPYGYVLVGAQARSEPKINGDDTAANNYNFECRHLTQPTKSYSLWGDGQSWGSWGGYRRCPQGTGICGIQTQVERPQGSGDDTSLNDARFYCCHLPQPCAV